jgi:gliding motility-associated-like protein
MKTIIKRSRAVFALVTMLCLNVSAQIERKMNYIFTQDSVAGFDENAASAAAFSNACYGKEYKVFMYNAKRSFIKQKYNLKTPAPVTLFQNPIQARPPLLVGGACDNEDFELATANIIAPSAVQGWTLQSGTNNNSCQAPALTSNNLYTVYTAPIVDSRIPGTVSSYFDAGSSTVPSGNCFIRLNDDNAGAKAVRLSKAFIPTPNSALFQYAYIPVVEDGSHACCDQPGFNIKITVTNTVSNTSTVLTCPNISVAVPGTACSFQIPQGGPSFSPCVGAPGWVYANWTASAIDLTQYINNLVKIDVTIVDCSQGGHGAYFYFDAKCSPMAIVGNGTQFPAGTQNITLPTCGAQGATICATPGLGPYSWAGPNMPTGYTVPSNTNSCFVASLSATYSLYMNPPGSCAPILRVITVSITPAPLLLGSVVQSICGNTTAVITLTPSGSAASPSALLWSPPPYSVNSTTTVGTYTVSSSSSAVIVTVTATDPLGCLVTNNFTVNPPPPLPTFTLVNSTGSQSITCLTPTINIMATSNYTYGSANYFWTNAQVGGTFATSSVNITLDGDYTITITDPVTHCETKQFYSIGINTIAPTATVSPSFQNITCSLSSITSVTSASSPTVNITQQIFSPVGGTLVSQQSITNYLPAPPGIFTVIVTNNVNGCTVVKNFTVTSAQGFPTFSVVSPQNFSLGCNSTSCAIVNITQASTQLPPGGPVSYAMMSPGSSGTINPGPISTFTVCAPGTYTFVTRDNNTFCETRVPISILQNTFQPNISVVVPTQTLNCYTPKVKLQGTSTTNNVSYLWVFPSTPGTQPGDSISIPASMVNLTQTLVANYTLEITNNVNTCKSTSVIPVYQNLFLPHAIISGNNSISCKTPSVSLTNQSSTGIPSGSGFLSNLPVIAKIWDGPTPQVPIFDETTYLALTPGVYTLTATDLNNGCTAKGTFTISDQRNYPVINETPPPPAILDCGVQSKAKLSPTITSPNSSLSYTWIVPATASVTDIHSKAITTNTIGEYKIIVSDLSNGCQSSGFMEVVKGTLIADFDVDRTEGFAPLRVNFTNKSSSSDPVTGTYSVNSTWSFGNSGVQTFTTGTGASALFNQPGTYVVTLYISKGNCLESKKSIIKVEIPSALVVPNVFTPNGDGANDEFFVKATNLTNINAKIYDRWGHVVYELLNSNGAILWNGKNQRGEDLAEGTYFYIIKATGSDEHEYDLKGTVNLFR